MKKLYVIMNQKDEFIAYDRESMSYYWGYLHAAKFFDSEDDALAFLENQEDFITDRVMTDGTMYPPPLIQGACGLNFDVRAATATIRVAEIEFKTVFKKDVFGEIKEPTGYVYD